MRHALAVDREALSRAPAAGADHKRGAVCGDLAQLDRNEISRLVDAVGGGDRLAGGTLAAQQQGAAALAVVGALVAEEAALGAVQGHRSPA